MEIMHALSLNKFKANIKEIVDKAISDHTPIRISRRSGKDFIVVSAEDWDREQETMSVLSNSSLMSQIAESQLTYNKQKPIE